MTDTSSARLSGAWHDEALSASDRARALVTAMSLEEKTSQLVGLWVGADASGGDVAPFQDDMNDAAPSFDDAIVDGLGQLVRPYGTRPVDPVLGAQSVARAQRRIMAANRFGIPAQVHEECLAGFAAWRATAYPVPLSWGAAFDPVLVQEMGAQIGASLRAAGVHQGLAPVLDVVRDSRWGRVEETIGEDPYLVGAIGAAYVRGMESAGAVATLKHFAGYSASRGARNHAPVSAGPREMADVFHPPFLTALREGGARSVMNSYAEVDGVPAAADAGRLTGLLRDDWGFEGVVVADYFAVAFLRTLHRVAGTDGQAAGLALAAGIDVELPSVSAFGAPLREAVRSGAVDEALVDRAAERVLSQKAELGLLDADWEPEAPTALEFDTAAQRETALSLARESIVLADNPTGILPLRPGARLALVGPVADDPLAMLGCYSFPLHVGVHHPEHEIGIDIPSVLSALQAEHPGAIAYAAGCDVMRPGREGFAAAVAAAAVADVAVVAVGDRAGLFGRGTSGEGCDAADLRLPGEQHDLIEAVLATGTPTVILVLSGRPYALGAFAGRAAAVVQAFFPGQRGGQAIAEVLTGTVNPSGHLPIGIPRHPGSQPAGYLAPPLGRADAPSNIDPTPLYPFGHGLSYGALSWGRVEVSGTEWAVDGEVRITVDLANDEEGAIDDVVQLYLHDEVAQVTRPESRLIGFQRVSLAPGETARVEFAAHADLTSFAGIGGEMIVEPGAVELRVARSSADVHAVVPLELTGPARTVGSARTLLSTATVQALLAGRSAR
ncbi:glycoside hydrolase family 3 N-terminal domain-containing protein [Microbacterium sp. 22242]|uniref:beta-xylosidase/alpha-l-arabinosidase n=1 Tax=Microbacterium sp. 22242 TaxID=3453896 RepID=UPI003F827300